MAESGGPDIDVDEIAEVDYGGAEPGEAERVEVRFKDGTTRAFSGAELAGALAALNHWTPPTA